MHCVAILAALPRLGVNDRGEVAHAVQDVLVVLRDDDARLFAGRPKAVQRERQDDAQIPVTAQADDLLAVAHSFTSLMLSALTHAAPSPWLGWMRTSSRP